MTEDQTAPTPAADAPDAPDDAVVAEAVVADDQGVVAAGAVAVEDGFALLVASFADETSAKEVYEDLMDLELDGGIDIEGVLVVKADEKGQIHVQKMTDHSTRTGTAWGIAGGVLAAIFLPATIVGGAVALGIAGAAVGKAVNVAHKAEVADELTGVLLPGTSGILCLVAAADAAAVSSKMPQAKDVKTVPVDSATADAVKTAAAAASGTAAPAAG